MESNYEGACLCVSAEHCHAGAEQAASEHGTSASGPGRKPWRQRCTAGVGEVWGEVKALHRQPMYLANNWGFVPVQAALGVFTFWGPKASLM